MKRIVLALAAAAFVVLAGSACRGGDWRVSQLFGGPTSVAVLEAPQKVEAFRIDPHRKATADEPRIGDHPVTAGPVEVGAADAAELSSVFLDADTYDWQRAKACEFTPGVGLRFHRDASRLEVALCFECDELETWRMGRKVMMEDFDDARPRLVAVVKRLFPDDAKIQSLREGRGAR